ncbi:hypothetical protein MMC21_002799 [Puttea exsequens]|nr:hypothetical protein [Puttea exsequens]
MAEAGPPQSIQARIAALNLGQVGRAPVTADGSPPAKPQLHIRSYSQTSPQNREAGSDRTNGNGIGNEPNGPARGGVLPPPANITRTGQAGIQPGKPTPILPPRLPARKQMIQPSPALPPRRPSEHQLSRRGSNESVASTISTISTISTGIPRTPGSRTPSMDAGRIKAPVFDPASLPTLPPKRTKDEVEKRYQDIEKAKAFPGYMDAERARMPLKATKSTPNIETVEVKPPPTPALPPRPSRPISQQVAVEQPPPKPARSALSFGMNKTQLVDATSEFNTPDPSPTPQTIEAPPPVPLSSRPNISKIQGTKPSHTQAQVQAQCDISGRTTPTGAPCLVCRDFFGPDNHAAKFPRESVPSLDWLATQLTSPFPSATDQARAIFTWLHHNIEYDVVSFFNNCVKPSTPASTLQTGLAVCEGYAGLFANLATKAGLENVVIGGHGKGFGFASLQPGQPIPLESRGHAWNAVKIDNGYWKLIDPCWGAGNVKGHGQPYNKAFSPRQFTMSNEEFGLRHFPQNKSQFFRDDGRKISWEEYIVGDPGGELVQVYSNVAPTEGISETSFLPSHKCVPIAPSAHPGPTIRFQFSRVCEHWFPTINGPGKPFLYLLAIHGVDGREKEYVIFETNGSFWWADVEPRRLGARGQTVNVYAVDTVGGMTGRGLGREEWGGALRKGVGFAGLAAWELI